MNSVKKLMRRDSGIALLTTLLLMLLMSSLLVGFILLITSGQKLSGTNNDYSRAFYASEAGMEKITADLGTLFDTNYSPSAAQINAIASMPPAISGIQYIQYNGASGYQVRYATDSSGNPLASVSQIQSGAYQGMTALATQYTLLVTARTASNNEVKLQRTTQTVGIPMFQFGVFSDTDLSFFPGPDFDFGGRTHTNGNLFLAAGGTLKLSDRVTAVKDVIRTNLSNGFPTTTGSYGGTVDVTTSPGAASYRALAYTEGSLVGTVGSAVDPNWTNISLGAANYAGNLRNGATGAKTLNLGIVLLGNGTTQPVDMIRRPLPTSLESPAVLNLRYYAQASLRVLLSDNSTDITNLPCIDTATLPFDLSSLAKPVASWTGNAATLLAKMNTNNTAGFNTPAVPLAASGAVKNVNVYNPANGYWLPTPNAAQYTAGSGLPIIKGFIKIEVQTAYGNPCGTWKDVTLEVLSYGYAGKNLYPQTLLAGQYGIAEPLQGLPTTQLVVSPCPEVHPNAIIRLERVRDNPSNWTAGNHCGTLNNITPASQIAPGADIAGITQPGVPADYWPNTLFDAREGTLRDVNPSTTTGVGGITYSQMITPGGVVQYVELDAKNLAKYLGGALPGSGHLAYDSVNAPNDYSVYISDRRGNYTATSLTNTWPPLSFSAHETGEYGWNDFVNPASAAGCPNNTQDAGEDLDGLGSTGFYTYGQDPTYIMAAGTVYTGLGAGQYGMYSLAAPGNLYGNTANNAITANPGCTVTAPSNIWPMAYVIHPNEARENPNPFFRRAVKIVDGNLLTALGTCPGSVPCGLAIATENPAYVFDDFNANSAGGGFNDPNVAVSLNADAVTLLSKNFNDVNSFAFPYAFTYPPAPAVGSPVRNATTTYYRTAIMAGKGVSFPQPAGTGNDFGTDGGVHNFLRYIENWGGQTLNYRGSIISMFTSRQAISTFKCCNTVYSPPIRGYNFDTEFLTPSLLPPRTPLFRDVNTTGFTQLLLPNQ